MALKPCKAVADILCVTEGTLSNWRVQGKGPPFVKIGGKVCYRDEDLEAFIDSGIRHSTSETKEVAA